jgi:hypothetical protein
MLSRLVKFEPKKFDCCINSCILFHGEYQHSKKCPKCDHDRFKNASKKTPWATFQFMSPFEQVRIQLSDPRRRTQLLYRHEYVSEPRWKTSIADVFDGAHYVSLHEKGYFRNKFDMAFSLTTDGFQIFKQ